MTVLLEQCPHCPAMLHPALVAAIRDARQPESCPARPKLENRVDARLDGELVPGELAAKRAVAYALLGQPIRARTSATGGTVMVTIAPANDAVEVARKLTRDLRAAGVTARG